MDKGLTHGSISARAYLKLTADRKALRKEQIDVVMVMVAVAAKITLQGGTSPCRIYCLIHEHIVMGVKVAAAFACEYAHKRC